MVWARKRELDDNRLAGPLEIEAMREAWARILEGHGFKLEYRRSRQIETYPHGEPLPGVRRCHRPHEVRPKGLGLDSTRRTNGLRSPEGG